jgi:cell division protein FtsI/penicillin-binding protein 2
MFAGRSGSALSRKSSAGLVAAASAALALLPGPTVAQGDRGLDAGDPARAASAGAALRGLSAGGWTRRAQGYVAPLAGGGEAFLTLDPRLQEVASELLETYAIPFGAVVVVSVPDGRVLALAGKSSVDPALGPSELALRPWAPAASVFKVVSAAALVAEGGLSTSSRVCYHGGVSSVSANNLVDLPKLDSRCDTLGLGLGKSQNAIVAKLAARHLTQGSLSRVTSAFGFGAPIPFDVDVAPSDAFIPSNPLEFARTAAGFWHTSLSVLHGAMIAAAVANRGEMPLPRLVEKAVGADGRALALPRRVSRRVIAPEVAREVGRMMLLTTTVGTAKHTFRDRRGQRVLPFEVAGKTGSLSYRGEAGDPALPAPWPADAHLGYSWFVGFAPAEAPRLAFAVLLANRAIWHIKAPFVARRLMEATSAPANDVRPRPRLASR